ncbi:hypothetical protein RUND412_004655 [Rhizina undulata]
MIDALVQTFHPPFTSSTNCCGLSLYTQLAMQLTTVIVIFHRTHHPQPKMSQPSEATEDTDDSSTDLSIDGNLSQLWPVKEDEVEVSITIGPGTRMQDLQSSEDSMSDGDETQDLLSTSSNLPPLPGFEPICH